MYLNSSRRENCCVYNRNVTKTGHISVQTTNPFLNQMKNNKQIETFPTVDDSRQEKKLVDLFSKKKRKDVYTAVSKVLISDLLKDSAIDPEILKHGNKKTFKEFLELFSNYASNKRKNDNVVRINSAMCSFSTSNLQKSFYEDAIDTRRLLLETKFKNITNDQVIINKNRFKNNNKDFKLLIDSSAQCYSKENLRNVRYGLEQRNNVEICKKCDNFRNNNDELINQLIERNARLEMAIKKFALTREKDRNKTLWNNFINQLKLKHKYGITTKSETDKYPSEYILSDCNKRGSIDVDYYDKLIEDVYESFHSNNNKSQNYNADKKGLRSPFDTNMYKNIYDSDNIGDNFTLINKKFYITREKFRKNKVMLNGGVKNNNIDDNMLIKNCAYSKSIGLQSDDVNIYSQFESKEKIFKETTRDQLKRTISNCERLKRKVNDECKVVKDKHSLLGIENKLDGLIKSINTIIMEIRNNKYSNNSRIETISPQNDIKEVTSNSAIVSTNNATNSTILVIEKETNIQNFSNDIDGNDDVSKDIDDTVVTTKNSGLEDIKMLSVIDQNINKSKNHYKTETTYLKGDKRNKCSKNCNYNNKKQNKIMTVAVNTDPLGLLALFKMSTEPLKQLLSLMSFIPYYSYLPSIQFSRNLKTNEKDFVCNICGASFSKPTELSKHIYGHNLGQIR